MSHFLQLPLKNITNINFEEDTKNQNSNINHIEPTVYNDYSNPIL